MNQIRPFPPTELIDQAEEEEALRLAPAPDLKEWVVANYLTVDAELYNPDHDHIAELLHDNEEFLAFAWASQACTVKKQMVLGQCEKVMFNVGGWRKARQEQQMRDWFGFVPIYLITIDASFCEQTSDREFCALIEHELYHIGVERDADGEIIYSDNTGLPKHHLAGHDVEEFIGVVKRHGASEKALPQENESAQGLSKMAKGMVMGAGAFAVLFSKLDDGEADRLINDAGKFIFVDGELLDENKHFTADTLLDLYEAIWFFYSETFGSFFAEIRSRFPQVEEAIKKLSKSDQQTSTGSSGDPV